MSDHVRNIIDTDAFYRDSCVKGYVQVDAIARNEEWIAPTDWGDLQITVNLSKPEKDPRDIAKQASIKADDNKVATEQPANPALRTGPCSLCVTDADVDCGYAQRIELCGEPWGLWYSPYGYYNEHCIAMSWEHRPMHIDIAAFTGLLEFASKFPTYFIGSNADLPIVGGSILAHDHYQGGRHVFPMDIAPVVREFSLRGFSDVNAGVVRWPVSVVRLSSPDPQRLADAAGFVLDVWRDYDDPEAGIVSHDADGTRHNTVTPIVRRAGEGYVMDLALRCNVTSEQRPLGVFHPRAEYHHIKKENIGLIEVMGRAILPPRLKQELAAVGAALCSKDPQKALEGDELCASHVEWALQLLGIYGKLDTDNAQAVLKEEVGRVFAKVLEDAGVFKWTPEGKDAWKRFAGKLQR